MSVEERELSSEEREHILEEEREDTLEVEVLVEQGSSSSFSSLSASADDSEGVVETEVECKGTGNVVALDVSGGLLLA
jgi:hypothetical protein